MPPANDPRARNKAAVTAEIAARKTQVATWPFEIQFSAEHRCNLRCIQCGSTINRNHGIVPLMDRKLPVRAYERFRKLDPALPSFEWLSLTGSGEPLISPDLPAILAHARTSGCTVAFNTNGTLWTQERADMVVDLGVDEIRFSIDGATAPTFERIRVNAKFDKVCDAVRLLVATKLRKGAKRPRVTFSSNLMRMSIEELPGIVDLAADLGAETVYANNTVIYEAAMEQEALVHHPEVTTRMVRAALARAAVRGVEFVNNLAEVTGEVVADPAAVASANAVAPAVAPTSAAAATPVAPVSAMTPATAQSVTPAAAAPTAAAAAPAANPTPGAAPRPAEGRPVPPSAQPAAHALAMAERATAAAAPAAEAAPRKEPAKFELPKSPCADEPENEARNVESILQPLQGLPADLPDIVHACSRPWTGLYVENDGYVRVCCFDSPAIGNLDEQSFEEIWNGPHVQRMRRSFLEGKPPEACVNCFIFAKYQKREDVFVQVYETGRSYVDAPGIDSKLYGVFPVQGWAIEPDGVATVELLLDGVSLGKVPCDQPRPDVAKAYPGFPDGEMCGWRVDVDCARLEAGDHVMKVVVHTKTGRRCEGKERLVQVVK